MNNAKIKSAPCPERFSELFFRRATELLLPLTTNAADSTRGKRRAASDLRTPIQQNISLKSDGSASGCKAGNNADCENAVFYRRMLVVSGSAGDLPYSGFLRRWRRFISPSIADVTNCPVLSPSSFKVSMDSTNGSGTRTSILFDFEFTDLVAITGFLSGWCPTIITKKKYNSSIDVSHTLYLVSVRHLIIVRCGKREARQCGNTNRASNHKRNGE